MNPALALRCDLLADESLPSWVSRLAVLNCADTAHEFCLDMGFHFRTCASGHPTALAKLGELTGLSHEVLHHASFVTSGHDVSLRGERLAPGMVRRSRIHVCPICTGEDMDAAQTTGAPAPYGRILWQISAMRSCHRHGCALVEITRPRGLTMHDFTLNLKGRRDELQRLADHPQPRHASALETYIANRLEQAPTGSPWLDRLSLHVVVPTCEMLGTLILFGSTTRFKGMTDRDLHCAGDAGFEIAQSGEPAIRSTLSEIANAFVRNPHGRQGPASIYGAFYLLLSLHHNDQAFEPVCDIVRRHVIETMPFGPGDHVLGRPVDVRFIHSAKTASRDTGRNPRRLRKFLIEVGIIGADQNRLSHDAVTFDVATTREVIAAETDSLMLPNVAALLQVSRYQVGQFADRGFLHPLVAYRAKHNHRRRIYARQTVDEFFARLMARAVPIKTPGETHLPVILAAQRAGCDAAFLVGLILNGQLEWVGHHIAETGMPSILVDLEEVRGRVEANPDDLSLRKVRMRMKTNRAVVRALLREGYLDARIATLTANRNPVRLIERSSLDGFQAAYVSIPELARTHDRSHHSVRQALNGIAPAIEKDRVGLEFYRRADLPLF